MLLRLPKGQLRTQPPRRRLTVGPSMWAVWTTPVHQKNYSSISRYSVWQDGELLLTTCCRFLDTPRLAENVSFMKEMSAMMTPCMTRRPVSHAASRVLVRVEHETHTTHDTCEPAPVLVFSWDHVYTYGQARSCPCMQSCGTVNRVTILTDKFGNPKVSAIDI